MFILPTLILGVNREAPFFVAIRPKQLYKSGLIILFKDSGQHGYYLGNQHQNTTAPLALHIVLLSSCQHEIVYPGPFPDNLEPFLTTHFLDYRLPFSLINSCVPP
jgi:hypothetical protein